MIIGITGGSGAGKTTLLDHMERRGILIIDCDAVYHRLLDDDAALIADINASFPGVVRNNKVDRKALGAIVFDAPEKLLELNKITHSHVDREVSRLINTSVHVAVDAIALIESGLNERCDYVIAVCAPLEQRVKRLIKREGISEEYALKRISAQKSDEWYAQRSDAILYNSGTEKEFALKCNELLDSLLPDA